MIFDQDLQELSRLQAIFSRTAGFEVVAVCSVVDDAVNAIRIHRPVIAIVSLDHPGDAVTLLSQVLAEHLPTRFLYLCSNAFAELVIKEGTIVSRSDAAAILPGYVRDLIQTGGSSSPFRAHNNIAAGEAAEPLVEPLTAREREIKALLIQCLSNKEIARILKVTEGTVKVHVHHILNKLSASNRRALMASAGRNQTGGHS